MTSIAYQRASEARMQSLAVALMGLWIGLWIGAILLSAWAIICLGTHGGDYRRCFWFWLACGPLFLLAIRLWKFVLTLCLLAFGWHELHKIEKGVRGFVGLWALVKAGEPHNQRRLGRYWRWVTERNHVDSGEVYVMSSGDRSALRFSVVLGIAAYCSVALSFAPQRHGLTNDTPIPEPTPPAQGYSQKVPVIHTACIDSMQNVPIGQPWFEGMIPPQCRGWDRANAPAPERVDPEEIQRIYAHWADLDSPYPGLEWIHRGRVYHWSKTTQCWVRTYHNPAD